MIVAHQVMYQIVINTAFVEGMGCFWGAEKLFWDMQGVYSTQVSPAVILIQTDCFTKITVLSLNPQLVSPDKSRRNGKPQPKATIGQKATCIYNKC